MSAASVDMAAASSTFSEARRLGLSIFPVGLDKRPLGGMPWKPYQDRAASSEAVSAWLKLTPPAWAVITGAVSRLIVLDFDGEPGRLIMTMNRIKPHVQTPSGGFHAWFEHPGWRVATLNSKSAKERLGASYPGLDIRADGGYAVFTGRNAKGEYHWLRPMVPDRLDSLPENLRAVLGLLQPPKTPKPSTSRQDKPFVPDGSIADELVRRALDFARTEGRNNAAFWLALQARDNGFGVADDGLLRRFSAGVGATNTKGQRQPFTEREARACWRSAFDRTAREPWTRGRAS